MPRLRSKSGLLDIGDQNAPRPRGPRHPKLAVTTPPARSRQHPRNRPSDPPLSRYVRRSSSRPSHRPCAAQWSTWTATRIHSSRTCQAGGVSASAMIRLALRQLADTQSPAAVADELLTGSDAQRTPGSEAALTCGESGRCERAPGHRGVSGFAAVREPTAPPGLGLTFGWWWWWS
jgi:hypothetical protein